MNTIKTICGLCVVATAAAKLPENSGCGDINVLYTGFLAYHPYVIEQGWDSVAVDAGLRKDAQKLIDAVYNTKRSVIVRFVLMGPDEDTSQLEARFQDVEFHITTSCFERQSDTPIVYNYDPSTLLWSVARRFPIKEDCINKPGKDPGYEEICDQRCEMSKIVWHLRQLALDKDITISNEAPGGI
ncbi:unnamed protein product [Clonostachys rhizophaga]|uniref:Uncharacterized protein n=1 Tax=Clonostachys rhizophaga TaxID=160324 RepID=A0A9N9VCB0_9HYPO|nr:unnamed protein product [Clonostachys rhizophaga]